MSTLFAAAALALWSANAQAAPAKFIIGDDKSDQWVRFLTWHQVWARQMQMNPGTEVLGNDTPWSADVALRRSRLLMLGQLNDRTHIVTHFGVNNQTFNGARKPQIYMHDAWVDFGVAKKALHVGTGLHYWNGVSRMTNASTISMMALDVPILNWPTIERTDQFARQMGIFAHGEVGALDYRVAVNRPFSVTTDPVSGGAAEYNPEANTWAYAGYFMLQLDEHEGQTLPYTTGTYLGKKSIFNLGAGVH